AFNERAAQGKPCQFSSLDFVRLWFGTRRSVVQIHSPRPFFSTIYGSRFPRGVPSIERAAQNAGNIAGFPHELVEFSGQNRLRTVRKRLRRIVMHFYEKSVGSCGDASARKRYNFMAPP